MTGDDQIIIIIIIIIIIVLLYRNCYGSEVQWDEIHRAFVIER